MSRKRQNKTRAERAGDLLSFFTVPELADSLGVSQATVRNWARGKNQPNDKNFQKIKRREYYYYDERINDLRGKKFADKTVINQSFALQELIEKVSSGDINLEPLRGSRLIDFNISVITGGEEEQYSVNFINAGSGVPSNSDVEAFLWRTFRQASDIYDGSNTAIFVRSIDA